MNNLRKYKLGFIILQYGRSDLTRDCIESIEAHVKDVKKLIIVVDNLSPDNSLQDIKERSLCGFFKSSGSFPFFIEWAN